MFRLISVQSFYFIMCFSSVSVFSLFLLSSLTSLLLLHTSFFPSLFYIFYTYTHSTGLVKEDFHILILNFLCYSLTDFPSHQTLLKETFTTFSFCLTDKVKSNLSHCSCGTCCCLKRRLRNCRKSLVSAGCLFLPCYLFSLT